MNKSGREYELRHYSHRRKEKQEWVDKVRSAMPSRASSVVRP